MKHDTENWRVHWQLEGSPTSSQNDMNFGTQMA